MRCDWIILIATLPCAAIADVTLADQGHDGIVVEAGSGAPLPGTKIIAKWMVSYSSLARSGQRCVRVVVVDSDASGRFRFEPWTRQDTPVTAMYLTLSGYRPGFRPAEPTQTIVGKPRTKAIDGGPVDLPPMDLRLSMTRWEPAPAERAEYLLHLLPSISCGPANAVWGSIYEVRKGAYEEFMTFPPEVQRSEKMDYVAWLKLRVEESRLKLAREAAETKEITR
jgi:hypothetical protein